VRDQVSHPYSTTGKIRVLYTLIFSFFIWDRKTKDFGLNDSNQKLFRPLRRSPCPCRSVWTTTASGWHILVGTRNTEFQIVVRHYTELPQTLFILLLLSLAPQLSLSLGLLHKIRLNFLEASEVGLGVAYIFNNSLIHFITVFQKHKKQRASYTSTPTSASLTRVLYLHSALVFLHYAPLLQSMTENNRLKLRLILMHHHVNCVQTKKRIRYPSYRVMYVTNKWIKTIFTLSFLSEIEFPERKGAEGHVMTAFTVKKNKVQLARFVVFTSVKIWVISPWKWTQRGCLKLDTLPQHYTSSKPRRPQLKMWLNFTIQKKIQT
jgi:hypothetical protein